MRIFFFFMKNSMLNVKKLHHSVLHFRSMHIHTFANVVGGFFSLPRYDRFFFYKLLRTIADDTQMCPHT